VAGESLLLGEPLVHRGGGQPAFVDGVNDQRRASHGVVGDERPLRDVSGTRTLRIAPSLRGQLNRLRIYNRYLRTSEALAHFHAGRG
jgi:hypothetical protein